MRYKFIILFLLIGFVSKAQVYQLMPQYGYSTYRMNFDSTIQIPTFCGVPKLGSNKINKGALAFDSCNNRFYFFNPKSQAWDTIKSGSTVDTTKFVKYTDTAAMLSSYLRSIDTTNKWVNSVTKLNDSTIQVIKGTTTSNITISSVTSATRLITRVWNNTGATILSGSVVYISGRHSSNLPTIALAIGNNEENSYKTFALVDGDIADNSAGFVIQAGKITGLNLPTSSYTDGDILYLSPTVPGGYTTTKPLAPYHICKLGSVTRAHPTFGSIEIKIENGWQLDELSDVSIPIVPADSVLLQFSRVDSLWHDVSPLTAIGNRYLKPTDSVSLSNRINLKLNISDTASMLAPYMRTNTANASYVTSVFRKTASDSVFFVRGGSNNFAFRDSTGGGNIYNTDGSLTSARTLTLSTRPLTILGTTPNRFHANGNITFGQTESGGVPFSDSTFKLSVVTTNLNHFRLKRNSSGGDDLQITYNTSAGSTYINAGGFMNISAGNGIVIGGGTSQRVTLGCNLSDGLSPVSIGYESWRASSASAILDIRSTTRGFLQPRMTNSEMNAISTPATGLSVFNTTDSSVYIRRGATSGWQPLATGNSGFRLDINGTSRFSDSVIIVRAPNENNELKMKCNTINANILRFLNTDNTAQGTMLATGSGYGFGTFRQNQINLSGSTGGIGLRTNNGSDAHITFYSGNASASLSTAQMQIFASTGNVLLQNGGTYTDGGYRLDVNGTTRIQNKLSVGTPSATSAVMEVTSTTQGFMPPRMTTAQRDLIATPAAGLIIYNTSTNKHQGYDGTTWNDFY